MPTRKSILMMSGTGRDINVVGKAIRADSYFGFTDGLHTVSVSYYNFVGGFKLQGTLSLDPSEDDWFDINLATARCNNDGVITYPKDPARPTSKGNIGDTGTDAFTFVGNFVYLRAVLTRDYLIPPPGEGADLGQISKVLLAL